MTSSILGAISTRGFILPINYLCRGIPEVLPFIQSRNYAARKGYREKKAKAKVKKEVKKKEFVPRNILKKEMALQSRKTRKFDDSWKAIPIDDVYVTKYYRWKVYSFTEALRCHKESHHPDLYNVPDAKLQVTIELNMQAEKQTRFVDNFHRIVAIPHKFDHGEERSLLVFSKTPEMLQDVQNAGAQLVGGVEIIKSIQSGEISLHDFQHIIAHPNILPELASLRGLMKRKFPNPNNGTLCVDLVAATSRFLNGISYSGLKDEIEKDFGSVQTVIGTLNMEEKHLEENFAVLVQDINEVRPKRPGSFITRCLLLSPPSSEKFKVDHTVYITENTSDVEKEETKAEAAN